MGVLSSKYYVSNKIQRKTYLTVKERYTKVKKKIKILQCSLSCLHLWWAYIPDKFMSHLCYMESHVAE